MATSKSNFSEQDLADALLQARQVLAQYRGKPLNEQNTKASIIEPILHALGWNVRDPAEVDREYGNRGGDNPVDYALLANGSPRLFVEAKGMGINLERKFASQVVSYATVAGAAWVVLTNGEEWRVYKALEQADVEDKLLFAVRVTDGSAQVELLRLLAKDQTAENPLETLWRMQHADRQVGDALRRALHPDAKNGLLWMLRKALPKLSPADIRASYQRFDVQVRYEMPTDILETARRRELPAHRIADGGKDATTRKRSVAAASLADLIAAGVVKPPLEISADYLGKSLVAHVLPDARVEFENTTYESLSAAATAARIKTLGPRAKNKAVTANGWSFWKCAEANGKSREIGELRTIWMAERAKHGDANTSPKK